MIRIKTIFYFAGLTLLLLIREAAAQPALHWTKQYGDTIWSEQGFANARLNPNLYVPYGRIGSYSATSPAFSGPVVMFRFTGRFTEHGAVCQFTGWLWQWLGCAGRRAELCLVWGS